MLISIKRRFDPKILKHFELKEPQEDLPGLTAELLADICDLVKKFGIKDTGEMMCRASLKEPKEIHVSSSLRPDNYSIIIIGPGGASIEGAFPFSVGEGTFVLWDRRISLVDMEVFIQEVDRIMDEEGYIDHETGQRIQTILQDREEKKYSVENVFVTKGSTMPVMFGGPNAETMRQQFDQPDKVVIIETPFGGKALCHVRDLDLMEKRRQAVDAVLQAHGLESIEQIGDLSWDKVMELRSEIAKVADEL